MMPSKMKWTIEFEFFYETHYGTYRQVFVTGHWTSVRVLTRTRTGKPTTLLGYLPEQVHPTVIAEQRPNGLWYTSRDWDVKGFDSYFITCAPESAE